MMFLTSGGRFKSLDGTSRADDAMVVTVSIGLVAVDSIIEG